MYWGIVAPLYGISLFLPTIINELGYVSSTAQLLTVPIYITAACLTIITAWYSDRSKIGRAPFIFIPMCAILIGFIIAIAGSAHGGVPGLVYAGVFIATCGIYPAFPGNICWSKPLKIAFTSPELLGKFLLTCCSVEQSGWQLQEFRRYGNPYRGWESGRCYG